MVNYIKKHIWVFIIVLSLVLIPQSLSIQAELTERLIVTGVAVDKLEDDNYEVVAQVVIASTNTGNMGGSGQVDFVKTNAPTIVECMNEISYLLGKTSGYSNINFLVMGEKLAKEDGLLEVVDYFIRDKKVPSSALILIAEKSAGDEIKKTKDLELNTAIGLQKLFIYKQTSMNGTMMQLHEFLNNSFTIAASGVINELNIEEEKEEQSSEGGASGSSGQGSESENSQKKKMRIKYNSNIYFLSEGKIAAKIDDEHQLWGINLINPNSKDGIMSVENVNDDLFKNAKIGIRLRNKKTKLKSYFDENGNPHVQVAIILNKIEVQEIENSVLNKDLYTSSKLYVTEALKTKMEEKIVDSINGVFKISRDNNVDFLNCADRLYSSNVKKWKSFISSIENPKNYLKHINFEVRVVIKDNV